MNGLPLAPDFLAMLDGSLDPNGIVDRDGRYVWVNAASIRIFGYPRDEVLGTHFRSHLLPDQTPLAMDRALHGESASVVRRLRCKDGSTVVLRTELIPLGGDHVLIHATDLTTLYESFERLSETEGILERTQEIGRTRSWVMHLPERNVDWVGYADDIVGLPASASLFRGTIRDALIHPEDRALATELIDRSIREGSAAGVFRTPLTSDGIRWIRMYARAITDETTGQVTRVEGVIRDITDVHEQDERYRELLAAVGVPMLIWTRAADDTLASISYVNGALCEMLGEPAEALLGQPPAAWLPPEELPQVTAYIAGIAAGDQPPPLQFRARRGGGSVATCLLVAAPVTYEGRASICAQLVDVTEEVRLRELAAHAHATEVALSVAAGIAHDFNNLLTGVLGYLDLTGAELRAGSREARYVQSALLAARRAATLSRSLLGYSRATAAVDHAPATEVVDVADVVGEAYTVTRAAIHGSIEMAIHEGTVPAHAIIGADSLLRVVVNLIVNARDALLERAASAGPDFRPQIDLSVEARRAAGVVEVSVHDNGTGIPEDVAPRIFERFITTKGASSGSGIGLRTAREIARSAGGDLAFTTQVGGGTTFVLTLPLAPPPEEPA